ncbi:hypothetical protein [Helicobacter pylori]|uniref:hypothetical protein n=1 Tax=Helicobacter pylori TaxID=210 RepID=UPI0030C5F64E
MRVCLEVGSDKNDPSKYQGKIYGLEKNKEKVLLNTAKNNYQRKPLDEKIKHRIEVLKRIKYPCLKIFSHYTLEELKTLNPEFATPFKECLKRLEEYYFDPQTDKEFKKELLDFFGRLNDSIPAKLQQEFINLPFELPSTDFLSRCLGSLEKDFQKTIFKNLEVTNPKTLSIVARASLNNEKFLENLMEETSLEQQKGSSNASEMKAEATGNPLIIEEVKLRAEIKNEEAKYKAFNKENYFNEENLKNNSSKLDYLKRELKDLETLQSSVMIPTHTEIKLYDLKNEESKDYELIKVKEVEPLKENASMSEELAHKKLKEQNKQIAEQNKEKLDAIKKQFASNLNDSFFNEERDCKLLEYKGFVVNAYKTKYQVEFSLSPKDNPNIAYSPSNMVYKNDTANMFSSYNFCGEIKFDGFLKRLDNAITKLPEKIKELENSIETTQENIAKYTRLVDQKPSYPRLEYLQALKGDHKTLIDDLAKMSKDRDYKPVFNPKSKEVLEKMNAEKRASLENESKTITEIENSNKEQEIKGNTKSDDEVKQHIEQVIEKEIGKGAEIISSKEVAITNNVDYYENEEELETTQSRSRR